MRHLCQVSDSYATTDGVAGALRSRLPRTITGKGSVHLFPLSTYSALGGLRQDPGHAAESSAEARTCGNGSCELRVLLSTHDSRGGVEPLAGLGQSVRALVNVTTRGDS